MSFLLSMWTNLPQSTKDQIIESIVEKFTELFREFYRFYMNSKENSGAKMTDLQKYLEILKSQKNKSLVLPSSNSLADVIGKSIITASNFPSLNISNEKVSDFSRKMSELATSDKVIGELSEKIGNPREGETEDDFVKRAKLVLTSILKNKMSK